MSVYCFLFHAAFFTQGGPLRSLFSSRRAQALPKYVGKPDTLCTIALSKYGIKMLQINRQGFRAFFMFVSLL